MKTIQVSFATLAVAVSVSLLSAFVPQASAQLTTGGIVIPYPPGIMEKLPIGSKEDILSWDVCKTNGLLTKTFYFAVNYYNTNSEYCTQGWFGGYGGGFDTYQDYLNMAEQEGRALCDIVKYSGKCLPGSRISFWTASKYVGSGGNIISGFSSSTSIGTIDDIHYDSLKTQKIESMRAPIHVPGLQKVRISIGPEQRPYQYVWDHGQACYSIDSADTAKWPTVGEYNMDDYVILSSWYSLGTNRVRIEITVDNRTFTYTQFGEMIKPPQLTITSHQVRVLAARGADVTVETSTDQINWSALKTIQSLDSTGTITIGLGKLPRQFYRAYCR